MTRHISQSSEPTVTVNSETRVYRGPELIEYGRVDQLTLGSGGAMLDISVLDFGFINDTANCDSSDGLTCFVTSSV